MSLCFPPALMHFCAVTARLNGGLCSPRKYGLNCTMPALVRSRVWSFGTNEEEPTRACSRSSKNVRKRSRIEFVSMKPRGYKDVTWVEEALEPGAIPLEA